MMKVGPGSAWIQGDAVCLGCGMVAELVGVPLVESGPHEICTSACKDVLEKLCVRNDHLTARVKEMQRLIKENHPGVIPSGGEKKDGSDAGKETKSAADAAKERTSTAIDAAKKSYAYTSSATATATAPLRVPRSHTDAATQAGTKEFEVGQTVVVRDRETEDWRKGEITRIEADTKRPWVYVKGLGEMMWGHVEFVEKKPQTATAAKPSGTASKGTASQPSSTAAKTVASSSAAAKPPTSSTAAKSSTPASTSAAAKQPAAAGSKTSTAAGSGTAAADKDKDKDAKPGEKDKPAVGTAGMDLLDMSELKDMAKTITELKGKIDKLQSENTRITRQLNTMTTEKATLNDKVLVAENRAHQVGFLTDVNTRQGKDLAACKEEVARLRKENDKLSGDLKHSRLHIDAVLGAEMSLDSTLGCVVRRLQTMMQDAAQSAEARKMACVMSPDDFREWLLAHDPHALRYQKHAKPVASGHASQYLRRMRR